MIHTLSVEPPCWWCGLKYNEIDLLFHGKDIATANINVNYEGFENLKMIKTESDNYTIVRIKLSKSIKPGNAFFSIIYKGGEQDEIVFPLLERKNTQKQHQGFSTADVVYLITPDRFANVGFIPTKNSIEKIDRQNLNGRHGGNLAGIQKHLKYFTDLGITALWLNPVLENNMKTFSYHGYAITNFYKIDERFGTNEEYKNFVVECHANGLKVIKDVVLNHCGSNHKFIRDVPFTDWINSCIDYPISNFRISTISDPYSSKSDKDAMVKGWFDASMPDLNVSNPYLQNYMIQNTLWWIEYSGVDGIRLDTQPYSDKNFVARWAETIFQEYPRFNIVGESWVPYPSITAYWQKDFPSQDAVSTNIPSLADFPMYEAIKVAFTESESMFGGLERLYHVLAQDFIYPNATNNLIFMDNHDVERFFTSVNYNLAIYKMAITFLLTTRGIPQIYYGTELLAEGYKSDGDGALRIDFPGGFEGDSVNAFTLAGLNENQREALQFTRFLLHWRKQKKAIHLGKLIHYVPENGFYVYFRILEDEIICIILNNRNSRYLKTERFKNEINKEKYKSYYNVLSGKTELITKEIWIPAKSASIFELKK